MYQGELKHCDRSQFEIKSCVRFGLTTLLLQMSSGSHQYLQNSVQKSNSSPARLGDIEHLTQLSANLSALCLNSEYSDVVLVVEGQKLSAHKVWFICSKNFIENTRF